MSLIIKVSGMVFTYISMLVITNYYGAEDWGLYSLCLTILNIFVLLPRFGFDNAVVRIIGELNTFKYYVGIRSTLNKIFLISLFLSAMTIIILYLIKPILLDSLIKQPHFENYFDLVLYSITPLALLTIIYATFQAFNKIKEFMFLKSTLINLFFLVMLIVFYYFKKDVIVFKLYFFSICLVLAIGAILMVLFLSKYPRQKPIKEKKYRIKEILNISSPMFFSSSTSLLISSVDILMLSYYKSSIDIGIYNSCLRLAALSFIPLVAVNSYVTPKFVEFYTKSDFQGLKEIIQKSTKMIFYASMPAIVLLILFPKTILGFFGEEFIIGASTLIILCIAKFINAISGSVGFVMQMTDQQRIYQNVIFAALLINIVLNFIVIPIYGFFGAALTNTISTIFWNVALIVLIKKKLGFWTIYFPGIKR